MDVLPHKNQFYVVGGTMRPGASSYIERKADQELYTHAVAGDFCYVLTPRQMGKSSLMVHTAANLEKKGITTIFVDLTMVGTGDKTQGGRDWYYGIAHMIARDLGVNQRLSSWWGEREQIGALQRLLGFFEEIVLPSIVGHVVIFIDEIDTTIGLDFSDDFFAAIRACFNLRSTNKAFERLSFVLLGVASPSDLIKDPIRTPFNIGQPIHLTDFTFEEAKPLAHGLSSGLTISSVLHDVLYWTGGHPYLTQKLCSLIAEQGGAIAGENVVRLVEKHFLSPEAYLEESNLSFIRDRLTKDKEHSREILEIYKRIIGGEAVFDSPVSHAHTALKLSGLVNPNEFRQLRVRNRIYAGVFTTSWCNKALSELDEAFVVLKEQTEGLLQLISKVGITLLATTSLKETLEQIVSLVFESVPAERCVIMIRNNDNQDLSVAVARSRNDVDTVGIVEIEPTIKEEVVLRGRSILRSDAQNEIVSNSTDAKGTRSILTVPLGVGDRVVGVIYADSSVESSRFTEDHLKVLTTLASVAAIRIEHTRLQEEQMQRERLERELALASEIQQRFQPSNVPQILGYQLQAVTFPAYEIGGDYYDFIELEDGQVIIAVGGGSGRGTSAALLMSSLHAAVHAATAYVLGGSKNSIAETIKDVNRYLADNIPANRFVTLFYAHLEPKSGLMTFVNAGHNPPFVVSSKGSIEELVTGGIPLGIMTKAEYPEGQWKLLPGDVLVIFSDGVTEAMNSDGEEFGSARLHEVVARSVELDAQAIRDRIESSLAKFCQGVPAVDDITLVIVKRETVT